MMKLYKPLVELVDALQDLEPRGTLVDDVRISTPGTGGNAHIQYVTHPLLLTIKDGGKIFVLRIAEDK